MSDETEDFKIGDVVMLKSGGPHMTVNRFEDPSVGSRLECFWFNLNYELNRDWFLPEVLILRPDVRIQKPIAAEQAK